MEIKEGDIVRYPVGFSLNIKRVIKDDNGDLCVLYNEHDSPYYEYIYKNKYNWGGALSKEMGFRLADDEELAYFRKNDRDKKIKELLDGSKDI